MTIEKCDAFNEYWTLDEAAECLDVDTAVYQELYLIDAALRHLIGARIKPLGGDGSNGTTEEPIVDKSYDNCLGGKCWDMLSCDTQMALNRAFDKFENG